MTENGQYTDISPEQRKAIEALAAGGTKQAAALVAGRTRRTLDRWLQDDPAFQAAMNQATAGAVKTAARRLSGLLEAVIDAVVADLETGEMSPRDNLRALDIIARHAARLSELVELEERIAALEARL